MTIYIEVLVIFNIYIDCLMLLMTSIILKYKIDKKKLFIASLIGGISTIILFFDISILTLILLQVAISILLIVIVFGKNNFFKYLAYFYLNSILLGGLIFAINNIVKLNYLWNFSILFILTPIIVVFYRRQITHLKTNYNLKYQVNIKYKGQIIALNSFFDTGNSLIDPYFNKPVILINETLLKPDNFFYIPYNTITEDGVIKAVLVEELEIIGLKTIKKSVIGLLPKKLLLNGVDCLLNYRIMEEANV